MICLASYYVKLKSFLDKVGTVWSRIFKEGKLAAYEWDAMLTPRPKSQSFTTSLTIWQFGTGEERRTEAPCSAV
jgi:hypothetical protein